MKIMFVIFLSLLLPVTAPAVEYSRVQQGSNIAFVSRQMNVPVEGVFRKFNAQIRFNPARPETGVAKIEIDLASIDAGSAEANDEVKGKSWFNVAEFPVAVFESRAVKSLGGGKYEAVGKMTIKGKSAGVRVPFSLIEGKGAVEIDGSFAIKRLDFDIGSGLWSDTSVVADEVQLRFHFVVK